jgi:hypothetical protein
MALSSADSYSLLELNTRRAKDIAALLWDSFSTSGILGKTEMPEDIAPEGVERGSLEHLLFITLTVAIDYQREANQMWASSRKSFEDPQTRYLYEPELLHETPFRKVVSDMQKHNLSKKPKQDAMIWRTVGVTFYKKWGGNPFKFLESCGWDSLKVLRRLKADSHLYNNRLVPDYPYLRGDKIGPLWLRMLRDNVGIGDLRRLEEVPIPVDIHVARATLTTGVISGQYKGKVVDLFEYIREAWFEGVKGLKIKRRPMIALDVDEPLWHLSKYGCTKRDKTNDRCPESLRCEAKAFCVQGKIRIEKNFVELDT